VELSDDSGGSWTLLTGHGHVLVEIARNPQARIRDISAIVDLTERTVQAIVADLEAAGYLTRTRTGRRTRYTVNSDRQFRHSAQRGLRVGPVLALLTAMGDADTPEPADPGKNPARQPPPTGPPATPGPQAPDPRGRQAAKAR
jgi:MarR family